MHARIGDPLCQCVGGGTLHEATELCHLGHSWLQKDVTWRASTYNVKMLFCVMGSGLNSHCLTFCMSILGCSSYTFFLLSDFCKRRK